MSLIVSLVGHAGIIGLVISSLLSFAVTLSLFSRFSRNGDGPGPEPHSGQMKPTSIFWGCLLGTIVNLACLGFIWGLLYALGLLGN